MNQKGKERIIRVKAKQGDRKAEVGKERLGVMRGEGRRKKLVRRIFDVEKEERKMERKV